MRALVQRVSQASVEVKEENYLAKINEGMVILLGVHQDDTINDVNFVADKCSNLRIFEDDNGKMNLSLKDINGEVLVVSQFTLYGDCRKGNRPNFMFAAEPQKAKLLYEKFVERMKENLGDDKIKTGIFAAMMTVNIVNEGPVTVLVEDKEKK
ncbi:MAG TPA: D-aminoacyl-tRNA deacylase [Ignavibacteriales bacterium]|nr:D-aminoacyl-tRNA deacylase [Ignavibacteriales bacterium]HOL81997.1 D-aminoacyl-tRNA deacylase [Ignavibacteriales bacterium]HOM64959.1 D-aminoacyl-tRNA deacylase [Ignavibacteriales bacterium]HPD68311.1 D-aminoacyl-tRNA deacylase [Ignavibacteriales bacterium]HPP34134.1 D-aminoacyl-tRNA deacylase [Ignavibacteriales bacterium]